MKPFLAIAAAALILAGCSTFKNDRSSNPYEKPLFVEKYLDPQNSPLDAQIQRTIEALRALPDSAALHNQLGQLLAQKGFPKDAEREFERAVNADRHFYPAWYNLGLLRMARDNRVGARMAFAAAVRNKPGHSQALFQLGLIEEQRGRPGAAIDYYAKAFSINRTLLDVRVNPRILDTKLVDLTLLHMYPKEHARASMRFVGTPPGYTQKGLEAPSPQPAAPVAEAATQTPPE